MKNPKIEIRQCEGKEGIFTEILVDGHKLQGVRRFELKQESGNSIPILTVDLNALNLSIDAVVVMKQYGMGNITDISFEGEPDKNFIIQKISELYQIDEEEIRRKVFYDWSNYPEGRTPV